MDARPEPPLADAARSWRVHPAAEHPGRTALVGAILVLSALACAIWTGSGTIGLLALAVLVASLRAYFLPCRYELTDEGAVEQGAWGGPRTLAWSDVRRALLDPRGVVLSPRATLSRWLPDRGLYLRTRGRAHRAAVSAEVAARTGVTVEDPVTADAR